jgi:hypothetical protein
MKISRSGWFGPQRAAFAVGFNPCRKEPNKRVVQLDLTTLKNGEECMGDFRFPLSAPNISSLFSFMFLLVNTPNGDFEE